jgi:hypothetical protein
MTPFTFIAGLALVTYVGAGITLIVLAYRTSSLLGNLAFFIPLYVVTLGNHRVESPHARWLARVWWAGFIVFMAAFLLMPR